MIRLDGNSLAAFRGCGVAGTVQRMAGCLVHQASPYSAAATAALKAQFPSYWSAISQYGYDNPSMVPYINEDPYFIASLINVGKTRWLVSDGNSWIVTNIPSSQNLKTKIVVCKVIYVQDALNFVGTTSTDSMAQVGNLLLRFADTIQCSTQSYYIRYVVSDITGIHTLENRDNNFYYDGADVGTHNSIGYNAAGTRMLFKTANTQVGLKFSCKECIFSGSSTGHFVPYVSQTQGAGMIDLTDMTFYENKGTGSFTISDSPA